jgi:hypothetical protein
VQLCRCPRRRPRGRRPKPQDATDAETAGDRRMVPTAEIGPVTSTSTASAIDVSLNVVLRVPLRNVHGTHHGIRQPTGCIWMLWKHFELARWLCEQP